MKRILALTFLLFSVLSANAATITGTIVDNSGTPANGGTIKFLPASNPGSVSGSAVTGVQKTVNLSTNGTFSVSLLTGNYTVTSRGWSWSISVPAGDDSYEITTLSSGLYTFPWAGIVAATEGDTNAAALDEKLVAGDNITLTTITNESGVIQIEISGEEGGGGGGTNLSTILVNGVEIENVNLTNSTYIVFVVSGTNVSAYATNLTAAHLATDSVSADELNAAGVESELEAVLDLDQQQGQIGDAQIADGAVDGGTGGEIADGSLTAADIGTDAVGTDEIAADGVGASELNATAVESELEAVLDISDQQGDLPGTRVGFADTDSNFSATDVQSAIEELFDVNGGGPNASDGKIDWSQLVNVPAGIADGDDAEGAAGSGDDVFVNGSNITHPDFDDATYIKFVVTGTNVTAYATNLVSNQITDGTLTADDLGADSVSASELNATGVEAELEAVLDLQDQQGAVTDAQVPNTITIDAATLASTVTVVDGTDATSFVGIFDSATGSLAAKTDGGLLYDASNGTLSSTIFNTPTLTLTGTGTLNGLDAIDGTGETTLESALDIAGEVTSTGMGSTVIADSVTVTGWVLGASTATTPAENDNDTSIATTAYVQTEISGISGADSNWDAVGTTNSSLPGIAYVHDIVVTNSASFGSDAGVSFTGSNGSVTLLGTGDGHDEDLKLDFNSTANSVDITSTTGVTEFNLGTIDLNTDTIDLTGTGTINGLDAIDGTSETTIEAAIDTLANLTSVQGRTVTLADAGADAFLAWDDSASAYQNISAADARTAIESGVNILLETEIDASSELLALMDDETGTGALVFGTSPTIGTPNLSGAALLAEGASIALDAAGSADGAYSGITRAGTAGATLAFGDLVYLDPTDSRWELCDANSASGADGDSRGIIGICVLAAASDGSATTILLSGVVRADAAFPSLTINGPIYVSETAGDITQTSPTTEDNVVRILGAAWTADEIHFAPDRIWTVYDAP